MTDEETIAPAEGTNKEVTIEATAPQAAPVPPAAPVVIPPVIPPAAAIPATEPAKNDIAKILEGIKLPEQRDFRASGDIPKTPEPEPAILEEHIVRVASRNAGAVPQTPVTIPAGQKPLDPERSSSIVSPMRTLKDDLQTVVRDQKISLVHAASLEEEKKHGQQHLEPEQQEIRTHKSRRTVGILFASIILILLGGGALFGIYLVTQEQQSVPTVPQSSILFAEQTVTFSLDNQTAPNLKAELGQAGTKQLGSLGSITRIVPTVMSTSTSGAAQEEPATLAEFFSALGMSPPQELMQAIGPSFFFGFHVVDTNAPLFVIPVTSYDHAFAGMLAWEPTMDADLSPIFTSISMTTSDASGLPVQRSFEDAVMRNYDVRELTDDSGNVVLYYSFPTPQILVIAESPYSFTEILSRLQAEREL